MVIDLAENYGVCAGIADYFLVFTEATLVFLAQYKLQLKFTYPMKW